MRRLHATTTFLALFTASLPMFAQELQFEVASIRPAGDSRAEGRTPHAGITIDGARVAIGNWSILQLIVRAYDLQPYQLSGPEWMGSQRFEIQAKMPAGSKPNEVSRMLRSLLADRFGLTVHAETRSLPGFALTIAKGGVKMKSAPAGAGFSKPEDGVSTLDLLWGSGENRPFGLKNLSTAPNGDLRMQFEELPASVLAQIVSSYLRAPVIDQTGLPGTFQVTLEFAPGGPASSTGEFRGTDLFTAVKDLGLNLERRTVPSRMLVVDHLERVPIAN